MKFVDLPYVRPDVNKISERLKKLINKLENASNSDELLKSMEEIRVVRSEFDTLRTLASIRHSINTKDNFYDEENKYFDSVSPDYASVVNDYYQALVGSSYKEDLKKKYGVHFLNLAELTVETFKPEIIDLQSKKRVTFEEPKVNSLQNGFISKLKRKQPENLDEEDKDKLTPRIDKLFEMITKLQSDVDKIQQHFDNSNSSEVSTT